MRLELFSDDHHVLGATHMDHGSWYLSNELAKWTNRDKIEINVVRDGHVRDNRFSMRLRFDHGRKTYLKYSGPMELKRGMLLTFAPESLRIDIDLWRRAQRRATQAVGVALKDGVPIS